MSFTPREGEILQLLGGGASIAEVAGSLYISQSTAKTHMVKLGAGNRTQAVMTAVRPDSSAPCPSSTAPQGSRSARSTGISSSRAMRSRCPGTHSRRTRRHRRVRRGGQTTWPAGPNARKVLGIAVTAQS
ncbi:MAG: two component transcriptional regulator, LuxR family [Frankiales bacterium]|nr:two component transcriptional regulator, LuxR family [Frankiales bacterium]